MPVLVAIRISPRTPRDSSPQVHDAKGAVRWIRAHGAEYGLATARIGVWGASAGAQLSALIALTPGDAEFEGTVGGNAGVSSAVEAAVN
ncbi:MAG TPA: alpha/beta hydrolase fold domain-containing protein, partial [Croceibacterium sp.]|nr:alpha/beta hydrolase fold domain-containing protein [Croceibacterium sp.]